MTLPKDYTDFLKEHNGGEGFIGAYGGDGQRHDAIAQSMHMPDTMPEAIRDMWARNLNIARDHNVTLTPQQFAEMFVDNNFAA